jgi:thiol-disulfide isomerase/thioredoxin
MNTLQICFLIVTLFLAGSASAGKLAPSFMAEDVNGRIVRLSDFKGKPVVINFWSPACAPCVTELPSFEALQNEHSAIVVLTVNVNLAAAPHYDSASEMRTWVKNFQKSHPMMLPVLLDVRGKIQKAFDPGHGVSDPYTIPCTILISKDGEVVGRINGEINWNTTPLLARAIRELEEGRLVKLEINTHPILRNFEFVTKKE